MSVFWTRTRAPEKEARQEWPLYTLSGISALFTPDANSHEPNMAAAVTSWSQTVSASPDWFNSNSLSFSAGVIHPSTLRGLVFSLSATVSSSTWV